MIPCLTLSDEREELDAQHMVCSYLVRASRQAMYELALEERSDPEVPHRAIQILKIVHQDWLEAQKAVAREMNANSTTPAYSSTATGSGAESPKLRSEVQ
jgi:hypothetical protein